MLEAGWPDTYVSRWLKRQQRAQPKGKRKRKQSPAQVQALKQWNRTMAGKPSPAQPRPKHVQTPRQLAALNAWHLKMGYNVKPLPQPSPAQPRPKHIQSPKQIRALAAHNQRPLSQAELDYCAAHELALQVCANTIQAAHNRLKGPPCTRS